jgi:membrane protein required for colicin V production
VNWVDVLLILVVGFSVAAGFASGFARVGIGFIATVFGIICGFWFYGVAASYVLDYVSSRAIANLVGFFVIFLGVVVLGAIVGRILARFFKWVGLSWFDRLLGGAFGLLRGVVIAVALVTVLLAFAPSPPPHSVTDSKLMPFVIDASNILSDITPREIKESFQDTKDKVKRIWAEHKNPNSGNQNSQSSEKPNLEPRRE